MTTTRHYIRVLSALFTCPEPDAPEVEGEVEWTVPTHPLEPFRNCPQDVWMRAGAFHLESLRHMLGCLFEDVQTYKQAVAAGRAAGVELVDLLWEAFNDSILDDLRLHAITFSLYGELIRDHILDDVNYVDRAAVRAMRPPSAADYARSSAEQETYPELPALLGEHARFVKEDIG